jgi:hypothetical protein
MTVAKEPETSLLGHVASSGVDLEFDPGDVGTVFSDERNFRTKTCTVTIKLSPSPT